MYYKITDMIDINACAGNWVFRQLPFSSPIELLKEMDKEGINKALVSSIEGIFYDDPQLANEGLFNSLKAFPSLIPVAVLNPKLKNWEKNLNACVDKYNIKAIKLYPNYHQYKINDARDLLEQIDKIDIPVIVQLRVQDVRAQNPICIVPDVNIAEVISIAKNLPETRFIFGGIKWQEAQSMAKQINELPNIWLDISNIEYVDVLRKIMRVYDIKRLLFGTHAPFFVISSAILKIKEAELSESEFNNITETNAINVFRL